MNRKQFIESQGATCQNWNWSWSFVNEKEKVVIFGAWDNLTESSATLILSENWKKSYKGHNQPGYKQAREHIRLIEEEGYQLKTFKIIFSGEKQDGKGYGPAKIKDFVRKLSKRTLKRVGPNWYALNENSVDPLPEEIPHPESFFEGASKPISVNVYERNLAARARCIAHYGYKCSVCGFDFKEKYGEIGSEYIHIHHLVPLSKIKREYQLNPIEDLRPICPNCHAIIHKTDPVLTIGQLRKHIRDRNI